MAGFTVISDVSAGLLRKLRDSLCPDPVQSPESIQLASPADKNADFQLGLFLYDLKDLGEYRTSVKVVRAENRREFPPRPLTLSYLLFLNNKAQIAAGAEAEQRILGKALQTMLDDPAVPLPPRLSGDTAEEAAVTFLNLSFEDKSKIWSSLSAPYQVALYFSASPVLLSSTRSEAFTRVRQMEVSLAEEKRDRPGERGERLG